MGPTTTANGNRVRPLTGRSGDDRFVRTSGGRQPLVRNRLYVSLVRYSGTPGARTAGSMRERF